MTNVTCTDSLAWINGRTARYCNFKKRSRYNDTHSSTCQRSPGNTSPKCYLTSPKFLGVTTTPEPCIVTEYMDGGSLFVFLKNNMIIKPEDVKKIVTGIAAGMLHLVVMVPCGLIV